MLVTDDFVFVHVPKTAGSWVQSVLRAHVRFDRGASERWTHSPHSSLPAELRERDVLAVLRNPWDWYVSWFHWTKEWGERHATRLETATGEPADRKRAWWEGLLESGRADFSKAVSRACEGDYDPVLTPGHREDGTDLYSAYVQMIVPLDHPGLTVLRFERLRGQLVRYLASRQEIRKDLRDDLRNMPALRTSKHGPARGYYSPKLRDLVGERTEWLCERFDYRFRK